MDDAGEPAKIYGRVTLSTGGAATAVAVRVEELSEGTTTIQDGTYSIVIEGSRLPTTGKSYTLTASRSGLGTSSRTITLQRGSNLQENFVLTSSSSLG